MLTTHSGLQVGGDPIYPSWQEQTPCPFTTLQVLYDPQGDGTHGLESANEARKKTPIFLDFLCIEWIKKNYIEQVTNAFFVDGMI